MKLKDIKFLGLVMLLAPLALTSCKDTDEDAINELRVNQLAQVKALQDQITELSGKIQEAKAPYIGADGYWYVNGQKTDVLAQGPQGEKGETGATGAQGEKGDKGDTGATGAQGETGATGAQGEKGDKGDTGATGAQGEKGDKGDKGDTGATGAQGEKGEKGDKGDTGATGAQGEKGETGAQGEKGEKGETGATGATGASAYEIAKKYGFEGTEEEWIASLKGAKGDPGEGIEKCVVKVEVLEDGTLKFTYSDNSTFEAAVGDACVCDTATYNAAVKELKEVAKELSAFEDQTAIDLNAIRARLLSVENGLEKALKQIQALAARATNISVDGVNNGIFGMIKTAADMQTNMLFGYYGKITNKINFPSTNTSYYADQVCLLPEGNYNSEVVYAGEFSDDVLGTVYYSVNPAEINFSGVTPELVNSLGEAAPLVISQAALSENVLKMGWTQPITRGASYGVYESTVTVTNPSAVEKIEINADDYVALAKALRDKDKTASVSAFATAVKNSLNAFKTNAYALQITSDADALGTSRIVKSPYSIQAALIKPVGYEVSAKLPTTLPGKQKAINFTNRVIKKFTDKIRNNSDLLKLKETLSKLQNIKSIEFKVPEGNVIDKEFTGNVQINLETSGGQTVDGDAEAKTTVTISYAEFAALFASINNDVKPVNEMISHMNDLTKQGLDLINKLTDEGLNNSLSNASEELINDVWSKLDRVYSAAEYRFELGLFAIDGGKYKFVRSSVNNATEVSSTFTAYMTNLNAELLTPAYKKHLVCTWASDGDVASVNASINKVYPGSQKKATVSGLKSGQVYELALTGLDYAGKQVTRFFYVKCK